ncbi:hypothetical protein [Rheinheimera pacifica]|uniref:hypothetical protein n=1 Tax=Rheinheimera pacifica TaxID=173990 RepID=UPI002ED8D3E3
MKKLILLLCFFSIPQLHAAGSMRIEVEVYNGPLSKSLEVQKAELVGTVNLTAHVLANITRAIHVSECRLGCFGSKSTLDNASNAFRRCSITEDNQTDDSLENFPYDKLKDISESLSDVKSEAVFPQAFRELYPQIFPIKKYRKFDPHWAISTAEANQSNQSNQGTSNNRTTESFRFTKQMAFIPTKNEDAIHQICPQLADVKLNILEVLQYISKPFNGSDGFNITNCRKVLLNDVPNSNKSLGPSSDCLTKIANVGKLLTEGAEHWATTQVAILPNSKRTRIEIARAAVTAAELGNEILARTDAIVRQQKGESMTDLLPTSTYLRDSEGTDYLNMFEWLDATPRTDRHWPTQSRTRMLERLINDSNWSKVNTAFAQGDGKVSMVFIKDDIGNWNLKNYDNDPSEMLDAYKQIGTNLFTSAAKLAAKMTSPEKVIANIAGVQQSTQQAQNVLFGSASSNTSDTIIINMETQVRQRISSTYEQYNNKILGAKITVTSLQEKLSEAEQSLKNLSSKHKEIEDELASNQDVVFEKKQQIRITQQEFDEVKMQMDTNTNPSEEELKNYVKINNNLIKKKEDLEQAQSKLDSFKAEHQQAINERLALTAEIEQLKTNIESQEQLQAQLPEQAIIVIEEILNNYQSTISSMQSSMVSNTKNEL